MSTLTFGPKVQWNASPKIQSKTPPLTRAAVQKLSSVDRTWIEAEQCLKGDGPTTAVKQQAMLFLDLKSTIERLEHAVSALQNENVELRGELAAIRDVSQVKEASRPCIDKVVGEVQTKIAQLEERVEPLFLRQQDDAAAVTTDTKTTYVFAAGKQAPQQQVVATSAFRLTPCKGHIPGAPKVVPDTKADAIKTIQGVLADMTDHGVTLRAADARVQNNDKNKPVAVVFSMLRADAHSLKAQLWAEGTRQKLESLGWKMAIHLPAVEYQSKQSLWVKHGQQMRAWVDAGKSLIYSNNHKCVAVVGVKGVLQL